jgi:DNA polymerase-3 subunit delta
MAVTAEQVLQDLKAGKYAPVYFLQGDEPYYIDQIVNHIENKLLSETEKGFNQMVMYGKDVEISAVLNNARRFPMMGERQVVIVKEAKDISDLGKKEAQQMLEAYVKNPLPSTVLVFAHKYKTLDGRSSLAKTLDKHALLVTTKKLYDNQLPDWVSNYVKEQGHAVDRKAATMLAEHVGNDLERLTNEIQKILINFSGEKVQIDDSMVQRYVGISKDYNVFELQKALAIRDVVKAQRIVQYFEANVRNNPIIPIIALLYSYFSKLLVIHHGGDYSEGAVASKLRIKPFVTREYLVACRNYPPAKVVANIHHLHKADLQAKGIDAGAMTEGQILRELIFRLMH